MCGQCALKLAGAAHAAGRAIMPSVLVYVSSDSPSAGAEATWQAAAAEEGAWAVRYEPAGVNVTLRVAVAQEENLVDGCA
jgi:hypothetical protein